MRLLRSLQLLLLLLPTENRLLLSDLIKLLHDTAEHEGTNKMSADSLATLFTPHFLCPRKLTPEAFHAHSQAMSGVVAFMIRQGTRLFNIPPNLATDIRAYWAEKERRKLSPKLDESVHEGGSVTASTVFTFLDRARTAQSHEGNPTETALAALYAHIQSLPESTHKRRLVKQFNRENGPGTPQGKGTRNRSLGDSIKKHIFNKSQKRHKYLKQQGESGGLLSRTQDGSEETMMTPRCRKPVLLVSDSDLCHLAELGSWEGGKDRQQEESDKENSGPCCSGCSSHCLTDCSTCGGSLTDTFRSYLLSRSLLTASPVDLSFSSRTEDFETSDEDILNRESPLNDSLLYCLNGNPPPTASRKRSSDQMSRSSTSTEDQSLTVAPDQQTINTNQLPIDVCNEKPINAKGPSSNCCAMVNGPRKLIKTVHETSL